MGKVSINQDNLDQLLMLVLDNLDNFSDVTREKALQAVHDIKTDITCDLMPFDMEPDCI